VYKERWVLKELLDQNLQTLQSPFFSLVECN